MIPAEEHEVGWRQCGRELRQPTRRGASRPVGTPEEVWRQKRDRHQQIAQVARILLREHNAQKQASAHHRGERMLRGCRRVTDAHPISQWRPLFHPAWSLYQTTVLHPTPTSTTGSSRLVSRSSACNSGRRWILSRVNRATTIHHVASGEKLIPGGITQNRVELS